MTGEIVPFGKYKGEPVEILAADTDYCNWLMTQPWFRDRWPNVYNVVINYGGEPQDSPEHNEMQARFLDDQWCFALADLLRPERTGTYGEAAARELLDADPMYQAFSGCFDLEAGAAKIMDRAFEWGGWDVAYRIGPASIVAHRARLVPPLPACTCQCDHEDCWHERHDKRGIDSADHCAEGCYWASSGTLTIEQRRWLKESKHDYSPYYEGRILIELKPDLGDDYPSVLRQVGRYSHGWGSKRCVIARRHAFQQVTWDQVQKIFAASGITLLGESDLA